MRKGHGKWTLRFVSPVTGKRRDIGLGTYPETSIADARAAGFDARRLIASGSDPIDERGRLRSEHVAGNAAPTFERAARLVHGEVSAGFRNLKHAAQWLTTLETYIFPSIGSRTVTDLKASDFADALRPIWIEMPETSSRVRQRCDTIMQWCAAKDYILASPLPVVGQLLAKQPGKRERVNHYPSLPWRCIPAFVSEVLHAGQPTITKRMLELLILTATRSGEVRGMRWEEIDLNVAIWTIPGSRMKAGVQHRVPLSSRAIAILEERMHYRGTNDLVFLSRQG